MSNRILAVGCSFACCLVVLLVSCFILPVGFLSCLFFVLFCLLVFFLVLFCLLAFFLSLPVVRCCFSFAVLPICAACCVACLPHFLFLFRLFVFFPCLFLFVFIRLSFLLFVWHCRLPVIVLLCWSFCLSIVLFVCPLFVLWCSFLFVFVRLSFILFAWHCCLSVVPFACLLLCFGVRLVLLYVCCLALLSGCIYCSPVSLFVLSCPSLPFVCCCFLSVCCCVVLSVWYCFLCRLVSSLFYICCLFVFLSCCLFAFVLACCFVSSPVGLSGIVRMATCTACWLLSWGISCSLPWCCGCLPFSNLFGISVWVLLVLHVGLYGVACVVHWTVWRCLLAFCTKGFLLSVCFLLVLYQRQHVYCLFIVFRLSLFAVISSLLVV